MAMSAPGREHLPTITARVFVDGWSENVTLSCGHRVSVFSDDGWIVGDHYDCPLCVQERSRAIRGEHHAD